MVHNTRFQTRPAAVAGSFYPANPVQLESLVDQFLSWRTVDSDSEQLSRILIVPHAGLPYSGAVAGAGFSRLSHCEHVILLGVSHYARFEGVAACGCSNWETPLGSVSADLEAVRRFIESCPAFSLNSRVHRDEHGLEVQLPFLQRRLRSFRIVPLLLGGDDPDTLLQVSTVLASAFDECTALVATSDLTHFPTRSHAEHIDRRTIASILTLEAQAFRSSIRDSMQQNVPGLLTCACGAAAIETAILVSNQVQMNRARLFAYRNSAEVSGEDRRVVGYASIGIDSEGDAKRLPPVDIR